MEYTWSEMNDPTYLFTRTLCFQLRNPFSEKPPFRFATVPDGSTAINLKNNYPDMYDYMKVFHKLNVKEGIDAVKNT